MNRKATGIAAALVAAVAIVGCSEDPSPVQPEPGPQATVITATGDIGARVAEFRTLLGDPANGGAVGQQSAGRREVNWDGAGARPFNNQNTFPGDFFNNNVTAGLVCVGTAFRNDSSLFAEVNPAYANEFTAFSPRVLFAAVGGNVIEAIFQVAGATTPAAVTGFGVVFADVDLANRTSVELIDRNGRSLGRFFAPIRSDANGHSFVGVKYDAPIVARVRVTCGTGALGVGVNDLGSGGTFDLVVVDNFVYGEPQEF